MKKILLCWIFPALAFAAPADTIQEVLLGLSWAVTDQEPKEAREERAGVMSRALAEAVEELAPPSKKALLAAAITQWSSESRFSLEVHQGLPTRWGSDEGRAKCFGQIHVRGVGIRRTPGEALPEFRIRQKEVWNSLTGTDLEATKQCALATMRALTSHFRRCGSWELAFTAYATGGVCASTAEAKKRMELMRKIASQL